MSMRKWLKKCTAVLLAAAIPAAGCQIPVITGMASEQEVQAAVSGSVGEAPESTDLTIIGNRDWIHFNSKDVDFSERKDIQTSLFENVALLGSPDNLAKDTKTNFVYQDGTDQVQSPEDNHVGLILNGKDNGVTFQVPGSEQKQLLRLYIGSWASEATVSVTVNGVPAYEETYGKKETSPGAQCFEHQIYYQTASGQDEVRVEIKTTKLYDETYGNINIQAAALSDAGQETKIQGKVSTLENQPEIQLTQEGNVDWMYFNNTALSGYEYKGLENSYFSNVQALEGTGGLTGDRFASFHFEDGATAANNNSSYKDEKRGLIFNHTGNGMTFDVQGSVHERTLRIYTGTYQARVGIEVYVNEEETPAERVEYTCGETQGKMTEIRFQTEKPEDVLHVRILVDEALDASWGSVSVHAVTLYDVNPPEIEVPDYSDEMLGDENSMVKVNHAKGKINSLSFKEADGSFVDVPFKTAGAYAGPAWKVQGSAVKLRKSQEDPHTYTGIRDGIEYGIRYSISEEGILTVTATMKNSTQNAFTPDQASLVLGTDTYMKDTYDSYKGLFFPTLLRCEKTHLWGYLESPEKKVISLAVDDPVSSYHLEYESGQHRLHTAVLDLMQKDETLPERHPRGNSTLEAGESRAWNMKLKLSDGVEKVKEDVRDMLQAPTIDADRYTVAPGEESAVTVYTEEAVSSMQVTAPDGSVSTLPLEKIKDGVYRGAFGPTGDLGVYKLTAKAGGYRSEAMITLRQSWKWYMQKAKEAAISHPAKGADCAESWYNLYSAYLGEKYFPDKQEQKEIDEKFDEIYYRVIKYNENGIPANNPSRIQNHSTTLGILADKFEAQQDPEDLVRAAKIADYLMSRQDQTTGAYMGPSGDYTSVIYPAKSIMELMKQEKKVMEAGDDSRDWQAEYDKQYTSVKRAMDNLVALKGDLHTEGQLTFEDGAFSCSATQLSEFALMHEEGSAERTKYMDSALEYLNKHQALEQEIIPDSRINGGSLRFWEAQYDVLLSANPNNMMNSPHGWTAWNIYGLFNMYQLTGEEYYLKKGMNAIGSCAQLMGLDGNLNWAFIADPYIKGSLFVQKENDTSEYGEGTRKNVTLGESYVDMISDWWRTPPDTNVGGYYGQGGACDNDVHEIFKAMEETVLTRAYVVEQEDGSVTGYNCTASKAADGTVQVQTMEEEITDEVSLNLSTGGDYEILFAGSGRTISGTAGSGLTAVMDEEQEPLPDELEEAKETAKAEVDGYKEKENYRDAQKIQLAECVDKWKAVIEQAGTAEAVAEAVKSAKAEMDGIPTDAGLSAKELEEVRRAAREELEAYKNQADYRTEQKQELAEAIAAGQEQIEKASNAEKVQEALDAARRKLDEIPTDAQLTEKELEEAKKEEERQLIQAKADAKKSLETYKNAADYREAQKKELANTVEKGKQQIESAATREAVQKILSEVRMQLDRIPTNAQLAAKEVAGVSLNRIQVKLDKGGSFRLHPTVTPGTAENKAVSFSSSDPSVVKVDSNGKIKELREGKAVVTVTTAQGKKTAACKVTVIYSGKWMKTKKGFRFKCKNGKYLKNSWKKTGSKWHYAGKTGYRLIGKQKIGKDTYYFDKKGVRRSGFQKVKKKTYYFGRNGEMVKGFQKINGKRYYFNKKGVMQTGRVKLKGKYYNFKKDGSLRG